MRYLIPLVAATSNIGDKAMLNLSRFVLTISNTGIVARVVVLIALLTSWPANAVAQDGSIVVWGQNDSGKVNVPEPNNNFVAIAGGDNHSLGLKTDGSIVVWGIHSPVPEPNTDFIAVAAGGSHSLGLKNNGSIVAWGYNLYGQVEVPKPNTDFVAVAVGVWHSLGLKNDGSIVGWGYNSHGQTVAPTPNTGFVAVSAGWHHSLGLKNDGSIVAWGSNKFGQLNVPAPNTGFVAIAGGGGDHSLGLKNDGSIVGWGRNDFGQVDVPAPNTNYLAITEGWHTSLGLKWPRQHVVLLWDTTVPFKVTPVFVMGSCIPWFGTMPATTQYPTSGERESLRNDVQEIFSRAGVINVSVTNTPTGGDTVRIYLTDWPVDPECTDLFGIAFGVDRYNLQLAGTAVVFLTANSIYDTNFIAQEVGHLLGLRHVDPDEVADDPHDQAVMDYDIPHRGFLPDFIDAITDIFDFLIFHDHNPIFHLRRYVDHVSDGLLALQGINSGSWDLGGPVGIEGPGNDPITTSLNIGGNDIVGLLFDIVLTKGYDPHTQKFLIFQEQITLTELSQIEFIIREGEYFRLVATLSAGGDPDIILSTGDPYDPANTRILPIDGSIPAQLQQETNTPPFYETIEEGNVSGKAGPVEDCNENDFPDYQDIATGLSQDCNKNGIPDECDIAGGANDDCNANGIPDVCDIADGTSKDANGNGVPDECDPPPCPWDLDGSGSVDTSDLLDLFAQWGKDGPVGSADFDESGTVDTADLLILFANWGPCP